MKRKIFRNKLWVLIFVPFIALTACEDDDENNASANSSEASFVDQASSMNLYEVRAGNMAQEQGQNEEVIAFGSMMTIDHQNAAIELNTASNGKYRIQLSETMEPRDAALYEALLSAAENFDSIFIVQMVQSHDSAIALFENASQTLTDAQLKDYATNMLPNLRMHREQAAELRNRLSQND